ncbi:MAG: universal stress protein [Flavobacteriaceae bacterium]
MSTTKFKKIGIGVAFSPNLKANIFEASRLALIMDSELVLVHVGEENEEKKATIDDHLASFSERKLKYSVLFLPGAPVDIILSAIKNYDIDLMILGALKRETFFKYYLGSIAREITRKADCSILLLINPSVDRVPCKHIVVNGLKDPKTKETINYAFYVGKKLNASRITVVEEVGQDEFNIKVDDDKTLRQSTIIRERLMIRENMRVKKLLEEVPEEFSNGISVKSQPIFGKRGYSIGHYAQVVRADLLVMNAPIKTSFWDRLFPHDIEHILGELPTDVLIIR